MILFQDKLLTRTDCEEVGDYVVPNVLSPRDLVFRPDIGHKLYHHPYFSTKCQVNFSTQTITVSKSSRNSKVLNIFRVISKESPYQMI